MFARPCELGVELMKDGDRHESEKVLDGLEDSGCDSRESLFLFPE